MNVGKAELEGLFVDELARLQPTERYMQVLSEAVLNAWDQRKTLIRQRASRVEQRTKALQQKLDRLEEALIFDRAIDRESYERQKTKLARNWRSRRSTRYTSELEEIDAKGILAFAERVLPRASELWVHSTLEQRQRLQQLFFPDGVVFDGKRFDRPP